MYPVNPERGFVHSVKSYPSVTAIPDPVDLAFLAGPAETVVEQIAACGRKSIKAAVVTAAAVGQSNEWKSQVLRAARRAGLRLLGPDSSGVVVTYPEVALTAHTGSTAIRGGSIAIAAQSGDLGLAILDEVDRQAVGLSSYLSLGDAVDITANDSLLYWLGDPFTNVILLYVESFGNPRRFGRLAREVGRTKPVVAVKGGRSAIGGRSDGVAVEALFRSAGVIRAETLTEMIDVALLLARQPLPKGRRVRVVADSPGPASLTAGALENDGLVLSGLNGPEPSIVDRDSLDHAIAAALADPEVDAVVAVIGAGSPAPEPADADKPLLTVRLGGDPARPHGAVYRYPESAARALSAAVRYAEWRARPEGTLPEFPEVDRAAASLVLRRAMGRLGDQGGRLDAEESAAVLHAYGIEVATGTESSPVRDVTLEMSEDPMFGPLISFRMAGDLARLTGDVAFRINPVSDVEASTMITELRSAAILAKGDTDGLADLILRLSYLVENCPEICRLSLDPVHVLERGVNVGGAVAEIHPLHSSLVPSRKDVPGRMLS
jgi:acyl-CoA synthetase (NDP forming)